jgi:hypothetical protein
MIGGHESVHNSIYSAKMLQERLNDVCSARIEDYAKFVAGPIDCRCVSMARD